jgi:hypothetical protein
MKELRKILPSIGTSCFGIFKYQLSLYVAFIIMGIAEGNWG